MGGKLITKVRLSTLVRLLFESNNRFIRVEWMSNQNKAVRKGAVDGSGAINPYWGRLIQKRYVATCRNNFNFENSVKNECARQGEPQPDYECGPRTWGEHIDYTPFVVHTLKGTTETRLHMHLFPQRYHNTLMTGYYVDGKKVAFENMRPFIPVKPEPTTVLDTARQSVHPVNARTDDVIEIKIGGHFYSLIEPTQEEMLEVVKAAQDYAALRKAG